MYQGIFVEKKEMIVHLWDDTNGYVKFPYPKYAYKRCTGGKYKSLYGDELERITSFDERDPSLFESDIAPEMRVLIDGYEDSDEPSKGHRIAIIDIEVNTDGGFPNVDEGDKTITAITLYDQIGSKYHTFVLDPDKKIADSDKDGVEIRSFKAEENLLNAFLDKWEQIHPTIVSGWNSNLFDMPYLFNRIRAVLGKAAGYRLSPIGIVYQNRFNKKMTIAGISCLDYIDLYKKFIGVMKSSYSLANVAKDEELTHQKLVYKGSLNDLYKNDLHRYVEYNLADVQVVVELDKKYDFIYLARSVCHKGHVPYEWFQMSSRFIDGAILMYLKRHNLIAPNKPVGGREEYEEMEKEGEDGFTGAFVKEPIPGLYDWIYSADITSLYPSTIMTLNVSPETKVGKIEGWDKLAFDRGEIPIIRIGDQHSYSAEDFKKMIANNVFSISSNGVIYKQDTFGVVPTILDTWFKERVEYRQMAHKFGKEGDKEQEGFYDRRQKRQKIFLNSVYGVLGLPIFRFYDRDNAEATTISGQTIIRSAEDLVNDMYAEKFRAKGVPMPEQDFVKYIDTDSLYISSLPLAKLDGNVTDMTQFTIDIVTEVANKINRFYEYMVPRMFNVAPEKNRIKIVPDVVAKKALWVAKKRYAMLKVYDMEKMKPVKDKNGNEGKLEVKGIDTVRSSFPFAFRKFAGQVLDQLLRGIGREVLDEQIMIFEETMDKHSIFDMSKTSSAKFISKDGEINYNPPGRKLFQFVQGCQPQVKAALAYNDLLKVWKLDKVVEKIMNGEKVKWTYLLPNDFCIEQLAMKADDTDPDQILEFVTNHIDRRKVYNRELHSKLEEIYTVVGWHYPNRASELALKTFDFSEAW
jgi:DNA polymerase elongation subunit (family B)